MSDLKYTIELLESESSELKRPIDFGELKISEEWIKSLDKAIKILKEHEASGEQQPQEAGISQNVTVCCLNCVSYTKCDPHGKRRITNYCNDSDSLFEMDPIKTVCTRFNKR